MDNLYRNSFMKAKYLGLELASPVIVSSSPYTASVQNIERCVREGAGAVVLKSIFEEQILREAASLDRMEGYGDAGEYLERYLGDAYKGEFLQLVQGAAATASRRSPASTASARATRGSNTPRPCRLRAPRRWN